MKILYLFRGKILQNDGSNHEKEERSTAAMLSNERKILVRTGTLQGRSGAYYELPEDMEVRVEVRVKRKERSKAEYCHGSTTR